MSNTEKLTVLQLVRGVKSQVFTAGQDPSLSNAQKVILEQAYNTLDAAEGDIIISEIDECIKALKVDAGNLDTNVAAIKKKIAKLKALSDDVQKAADAIKFLINILTSAGSLAAL